MGIYDNVRNAAKRKGVSVNQMEKDLGLARGSTYKYNKSIPSSEKLQKIAGYLDCTIEELMSGVADDNYYYDKVTAEIAEAIYQDKEMHMLFDTVRGSSAEDLIKFRDMILLMKRKESDND